MTKLDCLREELKKRGLTNAQTESKAVAMCLDIFANSGTKYTEIWREEQDSSEKLNELNRGLRNAKHKLSQIEYEMHKVEREKKELMDYKEQIELCETQEGRDAMRAAHMFIDSVDDIDTASENTAYIKGLAAILSRGGVNAIKEPLKKINKELPEGDS